MSTGGAGGEFERNLGAAFLAWLLVGAVIPIRARSVCVQVHFQARRIGWQTDDIVVEAVDDSGKQAWLLLQSKRQFKVSVHDEECVKTFQDAWSDFKSNRFDIAHDAIAIVTYLGTNRLLGDFNSLLTQARTSRSAEEFQERLTRRETLSERSKSDYHTVRDIVEKFAGPVNVGDIWRFLTILQVLSFDLGETPRKDEAGIRTILQFMRQPGDTYADVGSTWNELKSIAGTAAAVGQSLRREDLPHAMQNAYRRVEAGEHAAIRALRAHSEIVLGRIQDQGIGGLSLSRAKLLEQLEQSTRNARVVILVGGAGSGKSSLAKRYLRSRSPDSAFAFAAEEFKVAHIDQVLVRAQVAINWTHCHALIPKGRTFLVDGLERLLEGDLRMAFVDLLRTTADDDDSILLITCRDYHMEVIERSLLRPSGVAFERITVPELSDEELTDAEQAAPQLTPLLAVPALRALLRNPFLLTRAASLQTANQARLPETEQELRSELWHQVVCNEVVRRDNLPRRRAQTLLQISLDRARSFEPFVRPPEDSDAVQALALDGIVTEEPLRHFTAPAHDVWEDWSLLMWLEQQYAEANGDVRLFAQRIDTVPAIRRAYRKWLLELVEIQPERASAYVVTVLTSTVQDVFKDDTLVGVLQSSRAAEFLGTLKTSLLGDDARLLQSLLFLIRIACKTVSPLAPGGKEAMEMNWLVPAGRAWTSTLEFIDAYWLDIPAPLKTQILSFIEDWATGVSFFDPYPAGAEPAGALLQKLYPVATSGYGKKTERARVVALALKIPKSTTNLIEALAQRALASSDSRFSDPVVREFLTLFQKPYEAGPLCRDFPDLGSRLFFAIWFAPTPNSDFKYHHYSGLGDIAAAFGLSERHDAQMFPTSALQGPFFQLLRSQPQAGIRFITELINRACAFYGEQRNLMEFVEPPRQLEFTVGKDLHLTLWCNERLWKAYRGTSVMPDVMVCSLMALEKWCLEVAEQTNGPNYLRPGLEWILSNSNNVALIAVVASICTAHPKAFAELALQVLSCQEFFSQDIERQVVEHGALAVGGLGIHDEFLQKERIASNNLPHRKKHLEDLARDLQFTEYREQIHQLLDRFRIQVPTPSQQTEEDRLWRLALDRMDLRRFEFKKTAEKGRFLIEMRAPDPDIQAMVDASAASLQPAQRAMGLYVWARKAFHRETDAAEATSEWSERLAEVKRILDSGEAQSFEPWQEALGLIIAVCVRDHWDEMDVDLRTWCRALIIEALSLSTDENIDVQNLILMRREGIEACACVLPLMAARDAFDDDLRGMIVVTAMHPNRFVRESMLIGVSSAHMLDERLLPLVLNTLIAHTAATRDAAQHRQSAHIQGVSDLIGPIHAVLETASDDWVEGSPTLADLHIHDWPGQQLIRSLIKLFENLPGEAVSAEFFNRLIQILSELWSSKRDCSKGDFDLRIEHQASESLASFLLQLPPENANEIFSPMLEQVERQSDKVANLLTSMMISLDQRQGGDAAFWTVWTAITERITLSLWISDLADPYASGKELVHQAFFNIRWTRNLRRWVRLQGHFADVDRLFTRLPASGFVLDAYVRYLHDIGEDSLPNAIVLIVEKMGDSLSAILQADSSLQWYLDSLVTRMLFEQLAEIRRVPTQRNAMMKILDALVQAGSPAAFQLRDDFVTPKATALTS
jgi:hypothetical protein